MVEPPRTPPVPTPRGWIPVDIDRNVMKTVKWTHLVTVESARGRCAHRQSFLVMPDHPFAVPIGQETVFDLIRRSRQTIQEWQATPRWLTPDGEDPAPPPRLRVAVAIVPAPDGVGEYVMVALDYLTN